MDVNLEWDVKAQTYTDLDFPDVTWQRVQFEDDSFDCIVCDFPIDFGMHYTCLDNSSENAHLSCVNIKND